MIDETMPKVLKAGQSDEKQLKTKIRAFVQNLPFSSDALFSLAASRHSEMLKEIAEMAGEAAIVIASSQAQAFMPGGGLKDTTIDAVLETTDNRIYLFQMTERRGSVTRKRAQYDVAKGIVSRVLPGKKYKNVPDVRHITIAPGQLLNEKSCIMISQETLEYSPSEVFDGDHSGIRRRYFHRKGAYRKIFLNLDYEGPDKAKEQFMHDLKEPDYRKIQNPVLRRVMQEIKGDEEAMEIMCVRVEAFAKDIAKEYAAAEVKQANERADEYARKAAKSEKDLADTRKELDKTKSIANAFKSSVLARWLPCRKASASDKEAMAKLSEEFGVEEELISGLLKEAIA